MTIANLKSEVEVQSSQTIDLPAHVKKGTVSVEEAIAARRSERSFKDKSLTLQHISQLLWSAQGITSSEGRRAAPSAGALYPLDLYLVAGNVDGLDPGVYKYIPRDHQLVRTQTGDKRSELTNAALRQQWVDDAPAIIIFSAVYERTTGKYGQRGVKYVHMEVGYAGQNLFLQAEALGLGTVVVGAFNDNEVRKVLSLNKNENPLTVMPVGFER